jgi:hypothetical protein
MLRVKPIVKRVARWIGGAAIAFLILLFIGFVWGLPPYPRTPKGVRLEPAKRPLSVQELMHENAAYHYFKAVELARALPLSKQATQQMDDLLNDVQTNDYSAIEQALTDYRGALETVRNGIGLRNCQMPCDDLTSDSVNDWMLIRRFAKLICCEGKLAERNGHVDEALADYLDVVKFCVDCGKGSPILGYLTSSGIGSIGTKAIRTTMLESQPTPEVVNLAYSRLNEMGSEVQPSAEVFRYELRYAEQAFPQGATSNRLFLLIMRPGVNSLFSAAIGDMIADAEKPLWQSNSKEILRKWVTPEGPSWLLIFHQPIPRMVAGMLVPALEPIHAREMRYRLDLEATVAVCALQSFKKAHGLPPGKLDELVPAFLPAIPIDPFDGKPLRYRREGKEWVIWSVGSDLKDDNAAWHEFKYRKPGEKRKGGDIYFKSTEPQDDLADYLSKKNSKQAG